MASQRQMSMSNNDKIYRNDKNLNRTNISFYLLTYFFIISQLTAGYWQNGWLSGCLSECPVGW